MRQRPILCGLAGILCAVVVMGSAAAQAPDDERYKPYTLDPRFSVLDPQPEGALLALEDGALMSVSGGETRITRDRFRSWSERHPFVTDNPDGPQTVSYLVRTPDGTIVGVALNAQSMHWEWDKEKREAIDPRGELWGVRSLDNGKTWVDHQVILEGYPGALTDTIVTSKGHVVVPAQYYVPDPARHVTRAVVSTDSGATWKRGNIIDMGGWGHHDGAFECSLVELKNGTLWMLIRTSLDRFYNAYATEDSRYFRIIEPSPIETSNSPGFIHRLASGRLVMVWNPVKDPEGEEGPKPGSSEEPRRYGPGAFRAGDYSERNASWYRESIQLAFSEDDGKTWSEPIVFARIEGSEAAYPYVFEPAPGEMWLQVGAFIPWLTVKEADLVKKP